MSDFAESVSLPVSHGGAPSPSTKQPWSGRDWSAYFADWQTSGLSLAAHARRAGIPPHVVYYHRAKLRQQGQRASSDRDEALGGAMNLDLWDVTRLVQGSEDHGPRPAGERSHAARGAASTVIALPNGVEVVWPLAADPRCLGDLVAVLRQC